jgi:MFS family permease
LDKSDKRIAVVLFGTMFSSAISQSFMFAIMPVLGRQLGISDFGIGLVASLPALTYVLAAPILGGLVDRIGCMLLIRVGLLAGIVSNVAFAVTLDFAANGAIGPRTTLVVLVVSRIVLNVAWGGMFPAATAYMALSTSASRRVGGMALLAGASGIGAVVGPIIPSLMTAFSPVAPFYVVSGISGVSLLTTLLVDVQPPSAAASKKKAGPFSILSGSTLPFFVTAFLLLTSLTSVHQLIAFQLQDAFGLSPVESTYRSGQLLTIVATSVLAAQWTIASGIKRPSAATVLTSGSIFGAASMMLVIFGVNATSLPAFYASSVLLGVAIGLLLPTNAAALSLSLPQTDQGRAAGFLGAAQGSGRIVGPLLGTTLYAWSPAAPYWFGLAAFALIACFSVSQRSFVREEIGAPGISTKTEVR